MRGMYAFFHLGTLPTRLTLFNNLPEAPQSIILYTVRNQNWAVGMV